MTLETNLVDVVATDETVLPTSSRGSLMWLLNLRLIIGLLIITIMGVGSAVLPLFAPVDPAIQASYMRNLAPSSAHILGTNALGQDIFWFLVFSVRNSLILGVLVAVGVTLIATAVGLSVARPQAISTGRREKSTMQPSRL